MTRLERLIASALFLSTRRRVLAREVADRFGVSLRTVYRDIRALEQAGFPVEGNAGDGYRVPQSTFLRPLALKSDEAEALALAAQGLAASSQPPLEDAIRRAQTKLEAVLDDDARRRVVALQRQTVVPDFVKHNQAPPDRVLTALRDRRVLGIDYDDPRTGQTSTREIEPLGLVCVGVAWWLVAYCRKRRDARAFRIDAIKRLRLHEERFEPRDGLSLREVIARDGHLAQGLFGS